MALTIEELKDELRQRKARGDALLQDVDVETIGAGQETVTPNTGASNFRQTLASVLPQLGTSLASSLEGRGVQPIKFPTQTASTGTLSNFLNKEILKRQVEAAIPEPVSPIEQQKFLFEQQKASREQQKFQRETAEAEEAEQERNEAARVDAEDLLDTIREVKKGADFFGFAGKLPTPIAPSSLVPGGLTRRDRIRWANNLNKLLSQRVIDVMSEMKRVSKTGATGFGQLSEKELAVLQNASTALSSDLDPEDALQILNEMERIQLKFLGGGGQSTGTPTPDVIRLPGGFTLERA